MIYSDLQDTLTKRDDTQPPPNCQLQGIDFDGPTVVTFKHPGGLWQVPIEALHINHPVITDKAMWLIGYWCGIDYKERTQKNTE